MSIDSHISIVAATLASCTSIELTKSYYLFFPDQKQKKMLKIEPTAPPPIRSAVRCTNHFATAPFPKKNGLGVGHIMRRLPRHSSLAKYYRCRFLRKSNVDMHLVTQTFFKSSNRRHAVSHIFRGIKRPEVPLYPFS